VGDAPPAGSRDLQTFYLAVSGPNLVFHAPDATEVWFPAHRLFVSTDGTILAGTSLGAGSIYTVASSPTDATPAQLRAERPTGSVPSLPLADRLRYLQLPSDRYARVHALAERITAGIPATDTYDKILALEGWMGHHTRYTTDIPPLQPGQDTVVQFLFGDRRGYCEQISTSLTVMLRTLGIPTREATGYVPGSYNPLTDLWEVQAKDAHAWVQVWFPGYGWQSFDPTAQVPLANPSPADVLAHDAAAAFDRIPPLPAVIAVLVVVTVLVARWRRRTTPPTWAAAVTRDLEVAARRAGIPASDNEPLLAVAGRLEECFAAAGRAPGTPGPLAIAAAAERYAYGGVDPGAERIRELRRAARRLRAAARTLRAGRRPGVSPPPPPSRPTTTPRPPAGVARS
jgi:transglutaminase-like putative cysteine protease